MMTASQRALARIHAVAADHEISHESLHLWAESKDYASLKDVDDVLLDLLADWLDKPGEAERFRDTFWCVNAPSLLAEIPLFNPEQQAALDADADRIQARFRALERADL